MLNVVLDTCVLVSALKSQLGASFKILSLLRRDKFKIHLSTALMLEYEDVLKRPELKLNLTFAEIDKLLNILCLFGQTQNIYYQWRPLLKDENVKDFQNIKNFGIKIVTPQEFLMLIGEVK